MHGVSEGVDKEVEARLVSTTVAQGSDSVWAGAQRGVDCRARSFGGCAAGPPLPSFTPARPSSKQPDF